MRSDLSKQLCESERYRSWDCYGNYRNRKDFQDNDVFAGEDDEPFRGTVGGAAARESMKQRYSWMWDNNKSFGEHLSPLKGIVRKNEGKYWDKVYSEICKYADRRSAVGEHIFQHLFSYIQLRTYIEDGKVYYSEDRGYRYGYDRDAGKVPIEESSCEFYVHPVTGCITHNKAHRGSAQYNRERREREEASKQEELKTRRVVDSLTEFRKVKDVWFEYKFRAVGKDEMVWRTVETALTVGDVETGGWTWKRPRTTRRLVSKRTLSHKELKQNGLLS